LKYNNINEITASPEWKEFIDAENKAEEERVANLSLKERMAEAMNNMVGPQDGLKIMVGGKSTSVSLINKFLEKYKSNV
jgi:hypothetical protein